MKSSASKPNIFNNLTFKSKKAKILFIRQDNRHYPIKSGENPEQMRYRDNLIENKGLVGNSFFDNRK